MTDGGDETRNVISGGTQELVLQGRDFSNITITVAPASAAPVALAQLPALMAGFTGRDAELTEITRLLDPAADARTVVVSAVAGLAGVGKTELAKQAGHLALEAGWFPGGLLFIDLHGYGDAQVQPGQALDALLRALGVAAEHIPPTAEERGALYRSALAQISDPVLIIADNASAEAQVRPLLPGPGPHRVVVTSRHTLAGLGARLLDVAVLNDDGAVALLDTALREARPGDDRIAADRVGVVRLARICGGLPLALQITAALLKADPSRTVSDLADELDDEVRRLEALHYDDGGGTSAPSVAAAFELSYRQLNDATGRVFRLLPLNPGPDASTMAAAVLADLPLSEVRRMIGELVKAHLVEAAAGASGRWRMHDLLRLYAQQLSDANAEADGHERARDRLLNYYLGAARAASERVFVVHYTGEPGPFNSRADAIAWLDVERPSLVGAITIAESTGRDQIAVNLPFVLADYFDLRRRFDDKLATTAIALNVAQRRSHPLAEALALNNLGFTLWEVRRFGEAITTLQDAAAVSREAGARHNEGCTLVNLGNVLQTVRRFEEAIPVLEDAAAIFRETGDRNREGLALLNHGATLVDMGRFEEAIPVLQDAAAIFQETGDRNLEGMVGQNLGYAMVELGRSEEAIPVLQDATAIFQETEDRNREGKAVTNLGIALEKLRRFDEAITAQQRAVIIFRETDDRHSEGVALLNLGNALHAMRRFEEAITTHQNALAIFRETGDHHYENIALHNIESDRAARQA